MSSAVELGKPEKFLTEEELYEFRFLTSILKWSNALEAETGGEQSSNQSASRSELYRLAADFADLLVRHREVVAVTASDKRNLLRIAYDDSLDSLDDSPEDHSSGQVSYTENMRDEKRSNAAFAKGKHPPLNVNIKSAISHRLPGSMGEWLLCNTTQRIKGKSSPQTRVDFEEHTENVIELVRTTHRKKVKKERREACRQLTRYILLTSTAKIMARIKRGSEDRNLLEYISKSGDDLVNDTNGLKPEEVRMLLKFNRMMNLQFSKEEQKALIKVVKNIRKLTMRSPSANDSESHRKLHTKTCTLFETLGEMRDLSASSDTIVYNEDTLQKLQTIFAIVTENTCAAIKDLAVFKQTAQLHRARNFEAWHGSVAELGKKHAADLDSLADNASKLLKTLATLKQFLHKYLNIGLRCVQLAFSLDGVKKRDQPRSTSPTLNRSSALAAENDQDLTKEQEFDMFPSSSLATSELDEHNLMGAVDPDLEGTAVDSDETRSMASMLIEDPDFERLDALAEKKTWAEAAMAWLNLLCLHQTAISSLTAKGRADRNVGPYITSADFEHVEVSQDFKDRQLFVRKYLESFELTPGEQLTEDQRQHVRNWLSTENKGRGHAEKFYNPNSEMSSFNGTYHCETILMSLYLIGMERNELVDRQAHPGNAEDNQNHLRLPPSSITEALKTSLDVLPVSRRCCPACHALIHFVRTRYNKTELLYPGNHAVWSAVALPPFIPREAGMAVIEAARKAVRGRISKMINPEQDHETSSPSHVSEISSNNTSTEHAVFSDASGLDSDDSDDDDDDDEDEVKNESRLLGCFLTLK